MRLLKVNGSEQFRLVDISTSAPDDVPPYAVLSHVWGPPEDEITIADVQNGTGQHKPGFRKLLYLSEQALSDGIQHFWIDTCCIDRSSSYELTEVINSMFDWFKRASYCYVYLSDVSVGWYPDRTVPDRTVPDHQGLLSDENLEDAQLVSEFKHSKWFSRIWTLQDLLAPASVQFFSSGWAKLGDKSSLVHTIHGITDIDIEALRGRPLGAFSVSDRFSWATNRESKEPEDAAYALLGIFDVSLPLLYGEGKENALKRLRREAQERSRPAVSRESASRSRYTDPPVSPQLYYDPREYLRPRYDPAISPQLYDDSHEHMRPHDDPPVSPQLNYDPHEYLRPRYDLVTSPQLYDDSHEHMRPQCYTATPTQAGHQELYPWHIPSALSYSDRRPSYEAPRSRRRSFDSDDVRARKRPYISHRFVPQEQLYSLPLQDGTCRLLSLQPGTMGSMISAQLNTFDLDDLPPFSALSYVWGQEPEIHPVQVNGLTWNVRPNLYHALQRVRLKSGSMYLWVDSLCINQNDRSERSAQVGLLAKIFSKAQAVLIWLGEEDTTSKFAMDFIPTLVNWTFHWNKPWWKDYGFVALSVLLQRPWFRRIWVIQEAAISQNSTIWCGDRQIHWDHFALAINTTRARLQEKGFRDGHLRNADSRMDHLAAFHDSSAIRFLDIIDRAFVRSEEGRIVLYKMSMENLVELSTFSETTNDRDTIYALWNLSSDANMSLPRERKNAIVPDYSQSLLHVYADFVAHCCTSSRSLDIICRPWAPLLSSVPRVSGMTEDVMQSRCTMLPSWIATKRRHPYDHHAESSRARGRTSTLVGSSFKRVYNAHSQIVPEIKIGRNAQNNDCDGILHAKGILLGTIAQRSPRMADAIITQESRNLLGLVTKSPFSGLLQLPDALWRTMCADRDRRGDPAPMTYRSAMLFLLQNSVTDESISKGHDNENQETTIDVEELLESDLPTYVMEYLETVRDTVWNRRTFRGKAASERCDPLLGLVPHNARIDDHICILYGCSVPVILRERNDRGGEKCWELIGEAYVHGFMDGEALQSNPATKPGPTTEVTFEIM